MRLLKLMMFASDLKRAKEFYENVLGFPLNSETENSLTFLSDDLNLTIFKCEYDSTIDNYAQTARSVFVFEVDSIAKEFANLKAKGVNFLHKIPAENENCFYAAFQDPFGNVHEIAERKKFK